MKLAKLLKLSHAEFVTRRKTIAMSAIAAGIPFVILLMLSMIATGVKNIFLDYSGRPTGNAVYLAVDISKELDTTRYIEENHGEIIGEVTPEETEKYATPTELFAKMAGMSDEQVAMAPAERLLEDKEWYDFDQIKCIDIFLSNIWGYRAPFQDEMSYLEASLTADRVMLVRFPDVADAYNYTRELMRWGGHISTQRVYYDEVFTNLLGVYSSYQGGNDILMTAGLVIAGIIMIGTYVYLLDKELHTMVVYRALGASVKDLIVISLGYLIEIGIATMLFVVAASVLGVLIFSGVNAGYFGGLLREFYHIESPRVILLGWNMDVVKAMLTILGAAPVSLVLTLDQFSTKKLSQKLKRD